MFILYYLYSNTIFLLPFICHISAGYGAGFVTFAESNAKALLTPSASKMQPDQSGFAPCWELISLRQSVSASVLCITTAPHFFLTISNGSVPRTRHLRLSKTTTESFPVHHAYPNIPCVPFLVLLRLVRFCTSYTALSLPVHPVSFQDLSLSLGIAPPDLAENTS